MTERAYWIFFLTLMATLEIIAGIMAPGVFIMVCGIAAACAIGVLAWTTTWTERTEDPR